MSGLDLSHVEGVALKSLRRFLALSETRQKPSIGAVLHRQELTDIQPLLLNTLICSLMPPQSKATASSPTAAGSRHPTSSPPPNSWLQTPKPVRILFSHFPLRTLPANPLPQRTLATAARKRHTLFIYTSAASYDDDDDARLIPSFNPTCLKWQTYMLLNDVEFEVVASSNHASPSTALPFVIPAEESPDTRRKASLEKSSWDAVGSDRTPGSEVKASGVRPSAPVPVSKLESWIHEQSGKPLGSRNPSEKLRCEAYISLIEHRIRPAWVSCASSRLSPLSFCPSQLG